MNDLVAALLSRTVKDGDCLIWTGATNGKGYPVFQRRPDKERYVHRFICNTFHGLPLGKIAIHSCDRPSCINPDHLRPATYRENNLDAMARGRWKPPPQDGKYLAKLSREGRFKNAKLCAADIPQIRVMLKNGVKQDVIGARFGVGSRAISKIKLGQRWGHVP